VAQTLLTHAKMIQNLIGDFEPSEHPELFKAGFDFVADLIPVDSYLWASANLREQFVGPSGYRVRGGDDDSTEGTQRNYKIISVWRKHGGNDRKCKELSWEQYELGLDADSMYCHKNATKHPVYSVKGDGQLYISPTPPEAIGQEGDLMAFIKYYYYEPTDYFGLSDGGDEFLSYHITADLFGYPREAQLLATIKSAMNILQIKIGESVHEDEDPELLGLQQAQMQNLQQWFQSEASRLNLKWRTLGVEEG
jgi:hypothetical protein